MTFNLADLPLETVDTCQLCGATDDFVIIADRDRFGFPVRSYFCKTCGFIFITPRPTSEGYATFYESWYRPLLAQLRGKPFDITKLAHQQQREAHRIDDLFLGQYLTTGNYKTLIDIGGSTGTIGKHFAQKYGMQVTVLDPAPHELAIADQAGLNTVAGTIEDYTVTQTFDVILLSHAIHHLPDVNIAFEKMATMAHENTLIYMNMVNFLALARLRNYNTPDATQVDHCNSLAAPVLESFYQKHGFQIVLTDYSESKMVHYLLKKSPAGGALPDEFPYAEDYLKELVTIQASPNLEGYLKGIAANTRPPAEPSTRALLGMLVRRVRYHAKRLIPRRKK